MVYKKEGKNPKPEGSIPQDFCPLIDVMVIT